MFIFYSTKIFYVYNLRTLLQLTCNRKKNSFIKIFFCHNLRIGFIATISAACSVDGNVYGT